ncbi:hypothetical protein EBT25_01380 [bacterium]|nr:hypothetical protein [bacterium]
MESECPVCYESLTTGVYKTPCGHAFHKKCMTRWTETNNTCPMCRGVIQERRCIAFTLKGTRCSFRASGDLTTCRKHIVPSFELLATLPDDVVDDDVFLRIIGPLAFAILMHDG